MEIKDGYISQEMLEDNVIEARQYQVDVIKDALGKSTLIALPTGTGKTPVALVIAAERLSKYPQKKILMVAPTKPLVEQHVRFFRDSFWINDDRIVSFTGDVKPDKREKLWNNPDTSIVIATPQCLKNDIAGNRIDISEVSHLVVDECHRTSGNYPYSFISERYREEAEDPLVTGLSASPGSNKEEILSVCRQLGISNVNITTEEDSELEEYLPETEIEEHRVELPDEVMEIRTILEDLFQERLKACKDLGVIDTYAKSTGNRKIQAAKGNAQDLISNDDSAGYKAMSLLTECQHLNNCIRNVESRGVDSFLDFIERRKNDDSSASERMLENDQMKKAIRLAEEHNTPNRKMIDMFTLINSQLSDGEQTLVFADNRDTVQYIADFLNEQGIPAHRFVGQNNRDGSEGMSQKEQRQVLSDFRDGEYEVLVATKVAEEGLDIPSVKLVLFFEPVSSPIRAIQRRGRTGRQSFGKVIVMLAEGTSDIGRWYAAKSKESSMKEDMKELQGLDDIADEINNELQDEDDDQPSLDEFMEDEDDEEAMDDAADNAKEVETETPESESESATPTIIVDNRELQSEVAPSLNKIDGVTVELESLEVGDYVVSNSAAVERKSMDDFLDTLTGGDRSLFEQLADLSNNYEKSFLLLEGDIDDLFNRNIHKNAIYGALVNAPLKFGVSILHSRNEEETANMLARMTMTEQSESEGEVQAHGKKSGMTRQEQKEYVVSSIADIGPVTARALLEHFGSVKDVIIASRDELESVEGVGPKTADKIRTLVDEEY